jgi:hypothetical protein
MKLLRLAAATFFLFFFFKICDNIPIKSQGQTVRPPVAMARASSRGDDDASYAHLPVSGALIINPTCF